MSTNINARKDAACRRPIALAWPTGRPIYSYTRAEIVDGVDVYTRFLKRRNSIQAAGDGDAA